MNRFKLWTFTVLVVAAGFLALRYSTIARRAETVAALDARLASAAGLVSASIRSVAREAGAAAALVARDATLAAALEERELGPPDPAPTGRKARSAPSKRVEGEPEEAILREEARQTLASAERVLGFDLPSSALLIAGHRRWLAQRGEPGAAEREAMAFLGAAVSGQPRRGVVRHKGALWYGAGSPVGNGAGVVLLVPLDEMWARTLAAGAGADVTLSVPDVKPVSTAKPADQALLAAATNLTGTGDVGRPGTIDVSIGPVKIPRLPQPVAGGAPIRARAVPLDRVDAGVAIVSIPAAAALEPAAVLFWRGVVALALVLVVGVVLGLFVRSAEAAPQIPEALHAAAARIENGDFAARAPPLAGRVGTVAAALNRAAELAGPVQAAHGAGAAPEPAGATGEWYQGPIRAVSPEPEPPVAAPIVAPAPSPAPQIAAPPTQVRAAAAVAAAASPAAASEPDEETHWQQVFQDFLRTRSSCGEATETLTYERFRQKLDGNKAQLVAKYGCRTVRFQVYVKDGKAALKATPVK